jgi:hypothetical protein
MMGLLVKELFSEQWEAGGLPRLAWFHGCWDLDAAMTRARKSGSV